MRSQLERAINLAAKTGDKIIVIDELNDRSSVVMNLDDYEKLLTSQNKGNRGITNLTEEELLDSINNDIISWKDANYDKKSFAEFNDDDSDFDEETEDEEDEFAFLKDLDEDEEDEDEDSDFIIPHFDTSAEENIIAEPKEEELESEPVADNSIVDEPVVTPIVSASAESVADKTLDEEVVPAETEAEEPAIVEDNIESAGDELMPDDSVMNEPLVAKAIAEEAKSATNSESESEADQDVFYYHEPSTTETAEGEARNKKEDSGFTSLKDELKKVHKTWAIPEEVKKSAEDVKI
jgi:hypothetical protein